ncbi:MAG: hypothetical protein Q7S29_01485 [Candidatus Peribacter sp.]|nr:hypothetical protein [Candidatus Peribacter sp.]
MKQFQTFIFDSCALDAEAGKIELRYSLDDEVFFTETLLLPEDYQLQAPSAEQDAALAALHLIGGISYFKTCLPKKIEIRAGSLTQQQAQFWNTVYTKGLGEFFFKNQIDFRGLINFPAGPLTPALSPRESVAQSAGRGARLLVPIGGGKDSTVTAELLKKAGYDVTLFRIGKHPLIEQTAKIAGLPLLTVERHLAPELFKLNAEGALNGHVPITGYLSFLSIVIAELYGFHAVVMSNERSANEGNVDYLGEQINHQWSKSLECERLLQQYARGIGTNVEYFSLLRPLSELSIVQMFSTLPQYFSCVTSCNTNWKIANRKSPIANRWCGNCPKCAFAFAMFAAFLPEKTLQEIFGKNFFNEESLLPFYRQLLGLEGFKPFECVGTIEETAAAFLLAEKRGESDTSKAMQIFLKEVKPTINDGKKLIEECLRPSSDHCIPNPFQKLTAHS